MLGRKALQNLMQNLTNEHILIVVHEPFLLQFLHAHIGVFLVLRLANVFQFAFGLFIVQNRVVQDRFEQVDLIVQVRCEHQRVQFVRLDVFIEAKLEKETITHLIQKWIEMQD